MKPSAILTANLFAMVAAPGTEQRANALLDEFSEFTEYQHGDRNPTLQLLESTEVIPRKNVIDFLNVWYSFSRRTPQILLHCAAAYDDQADRRLIMINYMEEDGLGEGQEPHYDLLEQLIGKMGGSVVLNHQAELLIESFMDQLRRPMSAAWATGVVAGFEHPALDICRILCRVVALAEGGKHQHLLEEDIYLRIHVAVEPDHIVWAHGNCLDYMSRGERQRSEVVAGFQSVMRFWTKFWRLACAKVAVIDFDS